MKIYKNAVSGLPIPFPGITLREELAERCITQTAFAKQINRPIQVVNEIIKGKKTITADSGHRLREGTGRQRRAVAKAGGELPDFPGHGGCIAENPTASCVQNCLMTPPRRRPRKRGHLSGGHLAGLTFCRPAGTFSTLSAVRGI